MYFDTKRFSSIEDLYPKYYRCLKKQKKTL